MHCALWNVPQTSIATLIILNNEISNPCMGTRFDIVVDGEQIDGAVLVTDCSTCTDGEFKLWIVAGEKPAHGNSRIPFSTFA
jgi:hypothetical protein